MKPVCNFLQAGFQFICIMLKMRISFFGFYRLTIISKYIKIMIELLCKNIQAEVQKWQKL